MPDFSMFGVVCNRDAEQSLKLPCVLKDCFEMLKLARNEF